MSLWNHYHLARTIQDALETLESAPQPALPVAGGTDLLLDLQQGRHSPIETLVDITAIPEMNRLEMDAAGIYIGASVSLNQVIASPLVRQHAEALFEACSLIGGPQVRNSATLGGNVAHALPAGDGTIAMLALDAQAEVVSLDGRRLMPLAGLFLGPGRSAITSGKELILGFLLPCCQVGQGSAHRRVMRPQGVAIAILNMAVWLARDKEIIRQVRLSVGPAGPVPLRAKNTECVLQGRSLNSATVDEAHQVLLTEATFRNSKHRATAEYRQRIAGVLLDETLAAAWDRAG